MQVIYIYVHYYALITKDAMCCIFTKSYCVACKQSNYSQSNKKSNQLEVYEGRA